jgi:CRP/FNR family transcriptional regulator, cAMP and macrophage regulator
VTTDDQHDYRRFARPGRLRLLPQHKRFVEALCSSGPISVRVVRARDVLYREGQLPSFAGVIATGQVQLCRRRGARRVILTLLGPGDTVGDVPTLTGAPSVWDAVAVQETTILVVERGELRSRLGRNPSLAFHWAATATRQTVALHERLIELLLGDLQVRVAALIVHLSGDSDYVEITQQTLAGLLGTERTSVNRILRHLQAENVLTVHRGRLIIVDRPALHSIAKGPPS